MLKDQSSFFCKHELRSEASYEGSLYSQLRQLGVTFAGWSRGPDPVQRRFFVASATVSTGARDMGQDPQRTNVLSAPQRTYDLSARLLVSTPC